MPLSSRQNTKAVRFPHNVGTYPTDVTVSHTRRKYSQQQQQLLLKYQRTIIQSQLSKYPLPHVQTVTAAHIKY